MKEYRIKSINKEVIGIDEVEGVVTMYINDFNTIDTDKEKSAPTSFNRTIKNNFSRIKHLKNHDRNIFLGIPLEFKVDDLGLIATSLINKTSIAGKDMLADYLFMKKNKRTLEHSIGAYIIDFEKKDGYQLNKEYKLMEYSTVVFGANENTPVISVKNLKTDDLFKEFEEKINLNYSDETKKQIEKFLNFVYKNDPTVFDPILKITQKKVTLLELNKMIENFKI